MLLETKRLFLRELTEDDYEPLFSVLADSDIMMHYPYTFDESRVRGWIAKNRERYRAFGFGLWAVVLKETGEMIGDCGITMQNINGFIRPGIIISIGIFNATVSQPKRRKNAGIGALSIRLSESYIPI